MTRRGVRSGTTLRTKDLLLCRDFEYDLHICGREEVLVPYEEMAKELHFA